MTLYLNNDIHKLLLFIPHYNYQAHQIRLEFGVGLLEVCKKESTLFVLVLGSTWKVELECLILSQVAEVKNLF